MLSHIWLDNTKSAIHNASMRVNSHAYAKVIGAVRRIPIEPGPIVYIAVTGCRMCNGFRGLVNGEIVKFI